MAADARDGAASVCIRVHRWFIVVPRKTAYNTKKVNQHKLWFAIHILCRMTHVQRPMFPRVPRVPRAEQRAHGRTAFTMKSMKSMKKGRDRTIAQRDGLRSHISTVPSRSARRYSCVIVQRFLHALHVLHGYLVTCGEKEEATVTHCVGLRS